MALGNTPAGILRLVFRRVAVQLGLGVALGGLAAWWASQFVEKLLFGLPARDALTTFGAILVLAAVGALAAFLPARRAARIDP